ncbi:MAG TPA: 50S ribosomal protein L10 [Actinomycetota bacterium]|nr:50S ribosomal protein L10 [Actinomycetota bacterium]
MPNAEKIDKVAALKERIQGSEALLLTEFRGLSVHDATELRRSLADTARFSIVKNTLMKRAAGDAGVAELGALLEGPTAVAFVSEDAVTAAKRLVDAARRYPALVLKGAFMEGKVLSAEQARALAELESREVMLSQVAGMLKNEMARAASMFQALQGRFLGLLEAFKEKVPGEEAAPATDAAEADAAEADAADAETPAEVGPESQEPTGEATEETSSPEAAQADGEEGEE